MKKNYLLARENGERNDIGKQISSIGYNVAVATMKGRTDEYEESRDALNENNDDDNDGSNWMEQNENSVLEVLENNDVYNQRQIGVQNRPWMGKRCPSCQTGFKNRSGPTKISWM